MADGASRQDLTSTELEEGTERGDLAYREYVETLLADRPVQIAVIRSVDSTNRLTRAMLHAAASDATSIRPFALLAWHQRAGRGRLGRSWQSDAGLGVYLSLYWPLPDDRGRKATADGTMASLPLRVGCALHRTLRGEGVEVGLKWPNDLLVARRKLGGVLIELVREPGAFGAVIGVGVNVEHDQNQVFEGATSLRLSKPEGRFTTGRVAAVLLAQLVDELATERTLESVVGEYREVTVHREGDRIRWGSPAGTHEGIFRGIGDDGALLLEVGGSVEAIHAGEILLDGQAAASETD